MVFAFAVLSSLGVTTYVTDFGGRVRGSSANVAASFSALMRATFPSALDPAAESRVSQSRGAALVAWRAAGEAGVPLVARVARARTSSLSSLALLLFFPRSWGRRCSRCSRF